MMEAITRPDPIPIKMDATKNNTDVLRNISPTPTPIRVVPQWPMNSYHFYFPLQTPPFFIRPHIVNDEQGRLKGTVFQLTKEHK